MSGLSERLAKQLWTNWHLVKFHFPTVLLAFPLFIDKAFDYITDKLYYERSF